MPVENAALFAPSGKGLSLLFEISRLLGRHAKLEEALPPLLELLESGSGLERGLAVLAMREGQEALVLAVSDPRDRKLLGLPLPSISPFAGILSGSDDRLPPGSLASPVILHEGVCGLLGFSFGNAPAEKVGSALDGAAIMDGAAILLSEALNLRRRLAGSESREAGRHRDTPSRASINGIPAGDATLAQQVGRSQVMAELAILLAKVAPTDSTVLITGESGTGKELAARAVHALSPRAKGPFVAVNCAVLPEALIESELFGHEKGSFTGALARRVGRFEQAAGGSLFLDEVAELRPDLQAKLLRVLQERTFERVGGTAMVRADVRVIAATNRDLEREVFESRFRADLYWRLAVFPIKMPPLRERGGDIVLLADHFTEKHSRSTGRNVVRISTPALDLLTSYHWPGNVRELENAIERAVILSSDGVIHAYHLPPSLQSAQSTGTGPGSTLDAALARLERELIIEALKIETGNAAAAARRMGVSERRMGLALHRYGIDWRRFRPTKPTAL